MPPPGDLPNPGIKPTSLTSPALAGGFFTTAAAAKSPQSCPTLCDLIDGSPPGSPCPWDSPGKNIGVSCHFLLQCMKVKSESEVAQFCLTPSDPMDCSLPGSLCPWDFPGKSTGVGCHFLPRCMKLKSESEVAQSCPTATSWTAAYQAPPPMGFSRQE